MRWLVERSRDSFEDVGADNVHIDCGALVFTSGERIEIIYAAGQWVTVVPEVEQ